MIVLALLLAQDVFTAGQGEVHTYRIPSVILSSKGTLLAFCEGRKKGTSDAGDIDLVLRRSTDGGATWGPLQVVWDDAENTCGNPCPVVDRATGTVWLLLTHNLGKDGEGAIVRGKGQGTRTVWVSRSDDDGATWAKPVEITKDVKRPEWTWFATGPGVGIQLRNGTLVVPCDAKDLDGKKGYGLVITSADGGKTWKAGGVVGDAWNECQAAELADGSLLLNLRNHGGKGRARGVALSKDGGATWSEARPDAALVEPVCQASLLRLSWEPSRLLFSNPANEKSRTRMTMRLSLDEGKSWPASKELHAGPSAYSCLVALPDGAIGCLFECGEKSPYERIVFRKLTLAELEGK